MLKALLRLVEPEENPAGAVYGTITAGALLAAEVGRSETFAGDVTAVVIALVLYWLAHAYADALGGRLEDGHALTVRYVVRNLVSASTFLRGAAIPLVVLLASKAAGSTVKVAVLAALIAAATTLVLLEAIAAIRQHMTTRELLLQVAVGMVFGGGVLAVRAVLH